jgi:hypothetical protein
VNLLRRVAGLLTSPAREWATIAGEPADIGSLYARHIMILAAIPELSVLTGLAMTGGRYLGAAGIVTAVTAAMVSYAMALTMPLATALALAFLAPKFKSDGGTTEALKLVAYAWTPVWLAGVFSAFVGWARLDLAGGLYAVYLFFGGLTPVMGTPLDERVPFTLVTAITIMVLSIGLSWLVAQAHLPHFGF